MNCDNCPSSFGSYTLLLDHYVSNHTLTQIFQCQYCKEKFQNLVKAQTHSQTCQWSNDSSIIANDIIEGIIQSVICQSLKTFISHHTRPIIFRPIIAKYECYFCMESFEHSKEASNHVLSIHKSNLPQFPILEDLHDLRSKLDLPEFYNDPDEDFAKFALENKVTILIEHQENGNPKTLSGGNIQFEDFFNAFSKDSTSDDFPEFFDMSVDESESNDEDLDDTGNDYEGDVVIDPQDVLQGGKVECIESHVAKGKTFKTRPDQIEHFKPFLTGKADFPKWVNELQTNSISTKCRVCQQAFATEGQSSLHYEQEHLTEQSVCYQTNQRRGLMYPCFHCDKSFHNYGRRASHVIVQHIGNSANWKYGTRDKTCLRCDRTFTSTRSLKYHVLTQHMLSQDLKCSSCQAILHFESIDDHQKVCSKRFKQSHEMNHSHTKLQSAKKKEISDLNSLSDTNLPKTQALRGVTKSSSSSTKPVQCSFCDKPLSSFAVLSQHLVLEHMDLEQNWKSHAQGNQCRICMTQLTSVVSLKYHIITQHLSGKVPCTECNRMLLPLMLPFHLKDKHGTCTQN